MLRLVSIRLLGKILRRHTRARFKSDCCKINLVDVVFNANLTQSGIGSMDTLLQAMAIYHIRVAVLLDHIGRQNLGINNFNAYFVRKHLYPRLF